MKGLCQKRNATAQQGPIDIGDDTSHQFEALGVDVPSADAPEAHQALVLHSRDDIPRNALEGPANDVDRRSTSEMRDGPGAHHEIVDQRPERTALAYIYCSSQLIKSSEKSRTGRSSESPVEYSTTGLLGSLLKQLYHYLPKDQDVPTLSHLCFETKQDFPSRDDITKGIKSVVGMFKQAFIVIDGLDECSGLGSIEFELFCNFLASLAEPDGSKSCANVVVFSRPGYSAITNAIAECPIVEVDQGANSDDIGRFIGDRSKSLRIDSKSLEVIQGHLQDSADGMFLWVSLTIDSIKNERKPKNMKAAAKNVPKGLSGAYSEALKRVIRKEVSIRGLALKALLWTANSKKPLTESQLLEALVIEPGMTSIDDDEKVDGTQLTTDCEDLLVLRDGRYTLIHTSLGEFLRSVPNSGFEGLEVYSELQTQASRILVEDCVTYFKFDAFRTGPKSTEESFNEMLDGYPFLGYAGIFWGDHLREALEQGASELNSVVGDLLRPQHSREFLHQICVARGMSNTRTISKQPIKIFPFPSGTTPLHLLSIFGLDSLLNTDVFSCADLNIDQADGLGSYAMDYAIWYSRREICHWAVAESHKQISGNFGTSPSIKIKCQSQTSLLLAIVEHHWTNILSDLLKFGYSAADLPLEQGQTALHTAARLGYTDIVDLLLDSGADPNTHVRGKTPLHEAANYKHTDVMRCLLRRSADVSCRRLDGATALHLIVGSEDSDIIEELIHHGASVESRWTSWSSFTPLHVATYRGHICGINTLLKFGSNMEATIPNGWNPLLIAAHKGNNDAVHALLQQGANVAAVTHSMGWTVLHVAAELDHVDVITLVLTAHVPLGVGLIAQKDALGFTPLHVAASYGSTASAVKLLENGAVVDLEDPNGLTAAMLSLRNGNTSLATLLFDKYDADPGHIDHNGGTSLHMAARSGHPDHIQRLLSFGVDAAARDNFKHTALYYAVERGHFRFVEELSRITSSMEMLGKNEEPLGEYSTYPFILCFFRNLGLLWHKTMDKE